MFVKEWEGQALCMFLVKEKNPYTKSTHRILVYVFVSTQKGSAVAKR